MEQTPGLPPSNMASNCHNENKVNPAVPVDSQLKQYYFETQTKRLKQYYLQHTKELIGRRILFNNSVGTVKYFGELQHQGKPQGSNELWVGVEWDEPNRGKHNGTVSGFKYFTCPDNQGSMIKYQKIEFGYRLEISLFKRYFKTQQLHHAKDIYDNLKQIKQQFKSQPASQQKEGKIEEALTKKVHKIEYDAEAYLDTVKKNKKILIEFVGFDQIWNKINNLDKIQSISLAECKICDLGALGGLSELLKSLKVLSLEDNLISSWSQVYQLGYQLPELQQLSIAYNNLEEPSQNFQDLKDIRLVGRDQSLQFGKQPLFKKLKSLILIGTKLTWRSFFKVVPAFANAQQLILCKNDLSDVQSISKDRLKYLNQTTFLNLEQCNLTSFNQLHSFSQLPLLDKLILNKNTFQSIGRNIKGFYNLKYLSVQHCSLIQPVVLYQLSLIPNIQSLNVKHNPIGEKFGNSYIRMRAVAQLQKLNQINGALLKKGERRDFQIFYLRETFREYFAYKKVPDYDYDLDDFLKYCEQNHPNIPRLMKKFGNPYEIQKKQIQKIIKQEVKATENKKGTGMVEIIIQYRQTASLDKKKVPLSWTLGSLRNFFSKTTKIPVGMLKLICLVDADTEEEMNEDHKTLSFYSLKSGSKIIVERKPV